MAQAVKPHIFYFLQTDVGLLLLGAHMHRPEREIEREREVGSFELLIRNGRVGTFCMPVLLPITTLVFSFTTSCSQLLPPSASTPALIQSNACATQTILSTDILVLHDLAAYSFDICLIELHGIAGFRLEKMVAFSLRPSLILGARERFGSKHSMHLGVNCGGRLGTNVIAVDGEFPSFLPKEVKEIKDPFARTLAQRIQRLPVKVGFSESCIMSSCVKPRFQHATNPVVLLHCFDSSCLEWRCTYPLLEDAALETWAIDILGWGFSDLERLPPCDAASKRYHLYQLWRTHIKRPMILVGPSLGAAVAIDFAVNFPEAVDKLILINASVYAEGTGLLTKLPKFLAYAGVSLLKSLPLRLYANLLAFDDIPLSKCFDWANVGRLHCLLPWWEDATVNYMLSGGYNVVNQIKQVNKKVLVIWGECDNIVNSKLAMRLHGELPDAGIHQIPDCGHLPHVEKPEIVARLIADFARPGAPKEEQEPIVLNSVDGKNTFLFNVLRVENA